MFTSDKHWHMLEWPSTIHVFRNAHFVCSRGPASATLLLSEQDYQRAISE